MADIPARQQGGLLGKAREDGEGKELGRGQVGWEADWAWGMGMVQEFATESYILS